MHPFTHLLTGWAVAESADLGPKDRALVTLAAVIPDIDGLGIIAEIATEDSSTPVYWWSEYHHVLCHNVGFGLLLGVGAALLAVRRTATTLLVVLVFHLHLFADLIGSRGPDGYQWPIPISLAVFKPVAIAVGRAMGSQRMAQYHVDGCALGLDAVPGLEAWLLAGWNRVSKSRLSVHCNAAEAIR